MIISNSSPLVALGRINRLDILNHLFESVYIPPVVYEETVLNTHHEDQKQAILEAINNKTLIITEPTLEISFRRRLDAGEKKRFRTGN